MTKRNRLEITKTYKFRGKRVKSLHWESFWPLECEKTKNVGLYSVERWEIVI